MQINAEIDAAEGLVMAKTTPVVNGTTPGGETNATEPPPPMMKLAMYCATKSEGTSKTCERPKDTSSEGSSTEGGC